MSSTELLLIDLSSLAHPIWHMSSNEPDPNHTSTQIVARVRALSSQHPHAAICCDTGRSFRNDLSPRVPLGDGKYAGYKGDRPDRDARLYHQIDAAIARLRQDGYPIWSAENFEADDVIATAARLALSMDPDVTVLIASADKDLLQLVSPRVRWRSVAPKTDGTVRGVDDVVAKFGVTPVQLHDWLCLVGDSSDNVVGAKGIGPAIATKLLKAHGSLDAIYAAMDQGVVKDITPGLRSSLVEFRDRRALVSELIRLREDVPAVIERFSEIAAERVAPPMEETTMSEPFNEGDDSNDAPLPQEMRELDQNESLAALSAVTAKVADRIALDKPDQPSTPARVISAPPRAPVADFKLQLEPQTIEEAKHIAKILYDSGKFSQFPNAQSIFAVIMAGRSEGLPAMASMRVFHPTEKLPMDATLIRGKVMNSGKAKYFRCIKRTNDEATFETQRDDDPPIALSYSMVDARKAFQAPKWAKTPDDVEKAWETGNYARNPADMLVARAGSKLARLVYPDVTAGLYAPEEFD